MCVKTGNTNGNFIVEGHNKLETQWMDLVVHHMELRTKLGNWAKVQKKICRFTETKG